MNVSKKSVYGGVLAFFLLVAVVSVMQQYVQEKTSLLTGQAINGFGTFIDFVKSKLSGQATQATISFNITIPPQAPQIIYVSTIQPIAITEGTTTQVDFSMIVEDNGGTDYQVSANATFENATTTEKAYGTCTKTNNITYKQQNYTCSLNVWYFTTPGTHTVKVKAINRANLTGENTTTTFTILQTLAFTTSPSTIQWGIINTNTYNQTTNDTLQLNNTGNQNVGIGNISINATDLLGETYSAYAIYANNISIGLTQGINITCNETTSNLMRHLEYVNITGALLPYGNLSAGSGTAQENMYLCIRRIGEELWQQNYSTAGEGPWTIKIQ